MVRRHSVARLKAAARKTLPRGLAGLYRAAVLDRGRKRREGVVLGKWERDGRPVPPPSIVKQQIVKRYAREYGTRTLIETGTYLGDMIEACSRELTRIISIELDRSLYERARERFAASPHIEIHWGDSADLLPKLIASLSEPSLFWLDGHYSGGVTARGALTTPIMGELSSICEAPGDGHVILIDDARLFVGKDDYPTVDEVREFVLSRKSHYGFELGCDIMRFAPSKSNRRRGDLS
jgi:hypothetical protein